MPAFDIPKIVGIVGFSVTMSTGNVTTDTVVGRMMLVVLLAISPSTLLINSSSVVYGTRKLQIFIRGILELASFHTSRIFASDIDVFL